MTDDKWKDIYIKLEEDFNPQELAGIQALVNATGMAENDVIEVVTELGFDPEKLTKPEFEEVLKRLDGVNEGDEIEVPEPPASEDVPEVDIESEVIPEPVAEEEGEESPMDQIDRSLYFVLSLVTQALDGDQKAISTLGTIDTLIDGKVGNQMTASRKIADKFNATDDKRAGNAPRLKALFKDVYFKLGKVSKEAESQEGSEEEQPQ